MKKSYHSTVVPTTVAKTTRRRSLLLAGSAGVIADCEVLIVDSFVDVLVDSLVGGHHLAEDLPGVSRSYTISNTTQERGCS